MTLPETLQLPATTDHNVRQFFLVLQRAYEEIALEVNGQLHSNDTEGSANFTPQVFGVGTAGTATYADGEQIGWVHRQGIFVDVWFDVTWTGHTGAGNMYIELPYLVAQSSQKPFVGTIQASNITYAGTDYLVCNAIPNTRRLEIWSCTTAAATANVAIDTAGQLIGHVRYVGQGIERT